MIAADVVPLVHALHAAPPPLPPLRVAMQCAARCMPVCPSSPCNRSACCAAASQARDGEHALLPRSRPSGSHSRCGSAILHGPDKPSAMPAAGQTGAAAAAAGAGAADGASPELCHQLRADTRIRHSCLLCLCAVHAGSAPAATPPQPAGRSGAVGGDAEGHWRPGGFLRAALCGGAGAGGQQVRGVGGLQAGRRAWGLLQHRCCPAAQWLDAPLHACWCLFVA